MPSARGTLIALRALCGMRRMRSAVRESAGAVLVDVVVVSGAARSEMGNEDPWRHALKVRVAAKAHGGAANEELVRFLAGLLEVPRSSVRIASGTTGRRKTIRVSGIARDDIVRRLGGAR